MEEHYALWRRFKEKNIVEVLISITFSLKINKLHIFSEITQA